MNNKTALHLSLTALLTLTFLQAKLLSAQTPHGDHNPDHNGFVLMHDNLHFEVVTVEAGGIEIYFSSASRAPLPAAIVSDVVVEIERDSGLEFVMMKISDTGDFWTGSSIPVVDTGTFVRVGFVFENDPFFIDIPAPAFPLGFKISPDHGGRHECLKLCHGTQGIFI